MEKTVPLDVFFLKLLAKAIMALNLTILICAGTGRLACHAEFQFGADCFSPRQKKYFSLLRESCSGPNESSRMFATQITGSNPSSLVQMGLRHQGSLPACLWKQSILGCLPSTKTTSPAERCKPTWLRPCSTAWRPAHILALASPIHSVVWIYFMLRDTPGLLQLTCATIRRC